MTNLACWAVPVRGGFVLRADRSAAATMRAAAARAPRHWGWRIALLQPQSQLFSAPLAARAAVLAMDYARHDQGRPVRPRVRFRRRRAGLWTSAALGLGLVIASGGHWAPALAGVWLLAGRRWLRWLFGLDAPLPLAPLAPAQEPVVTSDAHAGLARIAQRMHGIEDDAAAYALGAAQARAQGLDDVAEVYAALAAGAHPPRLPPHVGVWVARDAEHDPGGPALPSPTAPAPQQPQQPAGRPGAPLP